MTVNRINSSGRINFRVYPAAFLLYTDIERNFTDKYRLKKEMNRCGRN